jgi:lipid II:glycine glycyltransferase (peptidoglycan interpeptide bridge formation enzyme)
VREGGADDLDTYHRLLRQTATRQGFAPFPRSYFEHMWEVLTPGGHIRLTFAECDGEVLAGQLAIVFGDTVVNKLSVWSGRGGNRRPNEALQWSTIRWAHDHGYRTYDLEGLKLSAARAIIAGERLPDSAEQSVSSYKLGFGGAVVIMPPARVYVTNPALRLGFRQVFPRISGRRAVKAVLKGMRTQTAPQQRKA